MQYQVVKPFCAGGRNYAKGELVDPFKWAVGQKLVNQRFVIPASGAVEAPSQGTTTFRKRGAA